MELRDYQDRFVKDLRAAFSRNRRVLGVMPCGSGKTQCFSYIARGVAQNGKRVLLQMHRKELVAQVSQALTAWNVPHAVLNSESRGTPRANVVVASAFTLVNRLKHFPKPDLLITDEAHHFSQGNTWSRVAAAFPNALSLGVTATPGRTNGHGLADSFDELVLGPSVAELTLMGYLCPVEVYASKETLDLRGLRVRGGDYVASDLEDAMDKPKITGNAVEEYLRICPGKRAIAFCCSVKHAHDVAEEFRKAGLMAEHVDGGMEDHMRAAALMRFQRGQTQVLTSADLISEGYDVPGIEVVIGLRPTKSLILYVQQLGRGQRPFPGKDKCIYLDHGGCTQTHGFIDELRQWSLDGVAIKQDRLRRKPISVCPSCRAMHAPQQFCPKCGHQYVRNGRHVDEVDGQLERITTADEMNEVRRESELSKKYEILVNIGKHRQMEHAERWAWHLVAAEYARQLAREGREPDGYLVDGLTLEERDRLAQIIRDTKNQVEMVV